MPNPSQNQELQKFLAKIGLGGLFENFLSNNLELQDLAGLTTSDLKALGLTKARDRKRVRVELERLGLIKETIATPAPVTLGLASSEEDSELEYTLKKAGLGEHVESFTKEGVSMDVLHLLTDEDLATLGVGSLSKRLKFRSLLEGLNQADSTLIQAASDDGEEQRDHQPRRKPRRNSIKCLSCGRMSRSGARNCKHCGNTLSQASGEGMFLLVIASLILAGVGIYFMVTNISDRKAIGDASDEFRRIINEHSSR